MENVYGVNSITEIDFKKWKKIVFLDAAASFSYPNNNINSALDSSYQLLKKYHFYEIFNVFEYKMK